MNNSKEIGKAIKGSIRFARCSKLYLLKFIVKLYIKRESRNISKWKTKCRTLAIK